LGYDQWASWLVIVEWFWLVTLAQIKVMPKEVAQLLTKERLIKLLRNITTTQQDAVEKETKHDIIALLQLMRQYLPKKLWPCLHLGATSYDIINTAYALQAQQTFGCVFWPKLCEVDAIWRQKIAENATVIQEGRTHLQPALPVTVGFWLAGLHNRFVSCARNVQRLAQEIPGKFSGAVGTSAAQKALFGKTRGEDVILAMLDLPKAQVSTQITPPEPMSRYYLELALMSGVFGNLGEDIRLLQSHWVGELVSASSSSSTMAHKKANPILAENICGMHVNILAEVQKTLLTLVSDLQRDLRWSSVMRSQSAVMVYGFQQLKTAGRLLNGLAVNRPRCDENFSKTDYVVMAELLHLALQQQGCEDSHQQVNQVIIPAAEKSRRSLAEEIVACGVKIKTLKAWDKVPSRIVSLLKNPKRYLGEAIVIAKAEAENVL